MHLGNSVICPVVGVPMLAIAGITAFLAIRQARKGFTKEKVLPLISLAALVFALQMVNFLIPGTGSSGHIVGSVLLAILLGPSAAFLTICSILLVQALFFADGGLLALGCNIFNMGTLACFVAYPFIYKPLSHNGRALLGAFFASVCAIQMASIAVVAEASLSGSIANIPAFASLMQTIHVPIALVEGLFASFIVYFALKTKLSKTFTSTIAIISAVLALVVVQFASGRPDGLEWSLIRLSSDFIAQTQGQTYAFLEIIQAKTAILVDLPSILSSAAGLAIIILVGLFVTMLLAIKNSETQDCLRK